jgi:hypothetical protein
MTATRSPKQHSPYCKFTGYLILLRCLGVAIPNDVYE